MVALDDGRLVVRDGECDRPRRVPGRRAGGDRQRARRVVHLDAQGAGVRRGRVEVGGRRCGRRVRADRRLGGLPRARHAWQWSAGVGVSTGGPRLEPRRRRPRRAGLEERTVWVDGAPREVGPVVFGQPSAHRATSRVTVRRGRRGLRLPRGGERARRDNLLVMRPTTCSRSGRSPGAPGRPDAARGLGRDGAPRRALVGLRPRVAPGAAAPHDPGTVGEVSDAARGRTRA